MGFFIVLDSVQTTTEKFITKVFVDDLWNSALDRLGIFLFCSKKFNLSKHPKPVLHYSKKWKSVLIKISCLS
jgi:hypothetical protein